MEKCVDQKISIALPRRRAIAILVMFVGAACFYSWLWPQVPVESNDTSGYFRAAIDLSDGQIDNLNERAPGLPLMMLLTDAYGKSGKAFWYAQLLFYFATVWLLCSLLNSFRFSSITIYSFTAIMLLPPNIQNAGYFLSENLAQFWLVLLVFGLVRWAYSRNSLYMLLSGFAVSMAILTRPTYQALPIVIVVLLIMFFVLNLRRKNLFRRMVLPAMAFSCVTLLIVGGFATVNYKKFGYFGVTHLLGYNLATRTAPYLEKLPDEYSDIREYLIAARDKELVERGSSHSAQQYIWSLGPDEIESKLNMSKPEAAKYMTKVNIVLITKAPLAYFGQVTGAMKGFWFPSAAELANLNSKPLQLLWTVFGFTVVLAFFAQLFAIFGEMAFKFGRYRSIKRLRNVLRSVTPIQLAAYILPISIIFYTCIITSLVDVGAPRQRSGDALMIFATILGTRFWFGGTISNDNESFVEDV